MYPFQSQPVRDLAWACFSPPLLRCAAPEGSDDLLDCEPALTAQRQQWLEQLDRDDTPLRQHLQQRPARRLGLYFEQLWHFFLQQDAEFELLAHNLPVTDGARTLGEFDCIYYCHRRQRHVHLELAVKYYLGQPTAELNGDICWLGPDCRDRLDRKVAHLLEQQTALSRTRAGAALLQGLGIDPPLREVALRGYLYQPQGDALPTPRGYPGATINSRWLHLRDVPALVVPGGCSGYTPLPRLRWLSRVQGAAPEIAPDTAAITFRVKDLLASDPHPVQLAALDRDGVELQRLFITPDDWPIAEIAPPPAIG